MDFPLVATALLTAAEESNKNKDYGTAARILPIGLGLDSTRSILGSYIILE
jgi:hypothetical protein